MKCKEIIKLSKHFYLSEFLKSQTAARHGINNTEPDDEVVDNLQALCVELLEPIRDAFERPLIITSGWRCLALNRMLGSKDTSEHILGRAADFEILGLDNAEVYYKIKDSKIPFFTFNQLILEYYEEGIPNSGWIHISFVRSLKIPESMRHGGEGQNKRRAFIINAKT